MTMRMLGLAALLGLAGCGGAEAAPGAGPVHTLVERGGSNPTVAIDARSGRGYIAWVGTRDGVSDVYLAVREIDAAADTVGARQEVRVNDVAGDAAPHEQAPAQVGVAPDGSVYVVWQNNTPVEGRRFPASDVRIAVSTDGGATFAPAITVNDDAGGAPSSHTFHDLEVAADGTVYVSWIDSRVRDSSGAAAAGAGPEIRVARSTDGGRAFGPSAVVDTDACPCCRTSLATAADGSVYIAWRKIFEGDRRDVVVARAEPGTLEFGAPVAVHDDGWIFPGCPHAGPGIAIAGDGTVHAAWYTGAESRQGLWYATSDDRAESFSAPAALLTAGWVPPSQVQLATAGDLLLAVWDDRREEISTVTVAVGDGAAPVSASTRRGKAPAVAAAGNATLIAWLDGEAVRAQWIVSADAR
ncbi:MAG: sialidase family protein [Gemmatimonadota bacterium]